MTLGRRIWFGTLTLAALAAAPRIASAQPTSAAVATPAVRPALVAERQRLRAELERVKGEVDALKRAERGMRDDYRLRARLADAEALARRLTDLDARLGGAPLPAWPATAAEPRALPGDGPTELEAKADILSDQARRLGVRADGILARARDLKARQSLRRHVGELERDPFSPLEGSKRRAMASGGATSAARLNGAANQDHQAAAGSDTKGQASPVGMTAVDSAFPSGPGPGGGSLGPATISPGAVTTPPPSGGAPPPSGGGSAVTTPRVGPAPTGLGAAEGVALSSQLRDLLDPSTLAEIQKLEGAGSKSGFEALERAGAALKQRAARLEQQAASLRAQEHVSPRSR